MLKMLHDDSTGIRDKINIFRFERDTLLRAGIADSGTATPPFLVIASNDINEDLNAGTIRVLPGLLALPPVLASAS